MTIAGDKVRVQTFVRVSPADAFAVFTEEIDLWWRNSIAYRIKMPSTVHLECKLDGRIFEQAGEALREIGRITAWDPPRHLAFTWWAANFVPGEQTHVDIAFEPSGEGTRVTLEHTGWAAIRPDHPVRHAQDAPAFIARLGMWWAGLLRSLTERAERTDLSRTGR